MTAGLGNTSGGTPFATGVDAFVYPQFLGYCMRAPTTQDVYNPGTEWQDNSVSPPVVWYTTGAGRWYEFTNSSFGVSSVTGTSPIQINGVSGVAQTGAATISLTGPYAPTSYTAHTVLLGEGSSSIGVTAVGTDGQVLTGNTAADPTFNAIGTKSGLTLDGVILGGGAGPFTATSAGVLGQILTSNGAGVAPTFQTAGGGTTSDYADFYALMPGDNAATIAVGAPILLPNDGPSSGTSITRLTSSTFQLADIATYSVSFQCSFDEAGQMMLKLGAAELAYTVSGRATGTNQVYISCLVTTTLINQVLSVVNPSGNAAALTITPIAGGTHAVSAHLVIQRVAGGPGGGLLNTINSAVPILGNINIEGTANQVSVTTPGSTANSSKIALVGPYTPATYTAHGVLVGEGTSSIVALTAGTNGQLLIGSTGADPVFAGVTAGSGIAVTTGAGTLALSVVSAGFTPVPVAGTSQAMLSQHMYIANSASLTTFTLPATASVGDTIEIMGSALNTGGWKVTYTTGQIIWGPAGSTTVTTGNAATAAAAAQAMTIVCVVANTTWVIISNSGTITLT